MKVLVNLPSPDLPGGVSSHYRGLRNHWTMNVTYNPVGRRRHIPGAVALLYDYLKFIALCSLGGFDTVLLNPSLGRTALLRDSLFLLFAKGLRRKVVVFFHGWDPRMQNQIERHSFLFRTIYDRADAFIVLASEFSERLRSWELVTPVHLSTTQVNDKFIQDFQPTEKAYGSSILFLARIEEGKGIFIALEAFLQAQNVLPGATLTIAGTGSALDAAKDFVDAHLIQNVQFLGEVREDRLIEAFRDSHIYLLPTSHGEGMPTSVLEAMAFGLPVITRPVGGIKDFFEDGKMGFTSETLDPKWFAGKLIELSNNRNLAAKIGRYNHAFARENFLASKVVQQLQQILKEA